MTGVLEGGGSRARSHESTLGGADILER